MDRHGRQRPPRPRRAGTAAPLRRLAPAAAAPPPRPAAKRPPTTSWSPSASTSGPPSCCWTGSPPAASPSDLRAGRPGNWMTSPGTTHRREAGHFVRWARAQKLTSLEFPATKWGGPARTIDTEARWDQARRLLHDTALRPEDRVAGLLVLLYAQGPSTISRLTLGHVQLTDGKVLLRLGREPVVLPEPLAGLTRQLIADRHGHAAIGDQGTSHWLFPEDSPAARSAPTSSTNDSASSGSIPARTAPPHSSSSQPTCPQHSSPACSASTSPSPSPGNEPAAETGPATPPTSAAAVPRRKDIPDERTGRDSRLRPALARDLRHAARPDRRSSRPAGPADRACRQHRGPGPARQARHRP